MIVRIDSGGAPPRNVAEEEPAAGTAPPTDEQLFRELMDQFVILAQICARTTQAVYRRTGAPREADVDGNLRTSLAIARTVFAPWCLEIMATIYLKGSVTANDVGRDLPKLSLEVLSRRLFALERMGLVQRDIVTATDDRTRYALTHKGLMIATLGEPVFLYLRLARGWSRPAEDFLLRVDDDVDTPEDVDSEH